MIIRPTLEQVERANATADRLSAMPRQETLRGIGGVLLEYNVEELNGAFPPSSVGRDGARQYYDMLQQAARGDSRAASDYRNTAQAFRVVNGPLLSAARTALGGVMRPDHREVDAFGHVLDGVGQSLMAQFGDRDVPTEEHEGVVVLSASFLTQQQLGIAAMDTPLY